MKIAFVGCGYVFDIYMRTRWAYPEFEIAGVFDIDTARSATVGRHYGLAVYPSYDALLADPAIAIVVNLTSIRSHFATTKRALEAGKNVYSEKPLTLDLDEARALIALAERNGVTLAGAPCNLFTDSVATLWRAVRDGAIGRPVLVYAELDDNPAHLMQLERVQSPTGAPFPYREELQEGCTVEHIAYHLVWLCAMFGPALSVTAFADALIDKATPEPLDPADTPDLSVACLRFAHGVVARVTCSWVAPRDHSFRVVGTEGQIVVDNIFHDQSDVRLERFSRVSLVARKAKTLRRQPTVGGAFGIGGRPQKLVRRWKSHAVEAEKGVGRSAKHRLVSWLRRREIYAQDKLLGIAEMARALEAGRPQPLSADFLLHVLELTLVVARAGAGTTAVPTTTFAPIAPPDDAETTARDFRSGYRPRLLERASAAIVEALHRR